MPSVKNCVEDVKVVVRFVGRAINTLIYLGRLERTGQSHRVPKRTAPK
jgi:hypothetical protein